MYRSSKHDKTHVVGVVESLVDLPVATMKYEGVTWAAELRRVAPYLVLSGFFQGAPNNHTILHFVRTEWLIKSRLSGAMLRVGVDSSRAWKVGLCVAARRQYNGPR